MTEETERSKGQAGQKTGARKPDGAAAAKATPKGASGMPREDPVVPVEAGSVPAAQGAAPEREPDDAYMLQARANELARENEELLDGFVRLKAEFENYRKRMLKEQTRILETAESGLVKKLLPAIDNLERALENAPGGKDAAGLRKGVEMVLGQLLDMLAREGLEVINPEGEPFDPEHHEAMMVVETDECAEDTVIDVVQKGYRFNGMLLRPAMVRVSCPVKGS